MAAFVFEVGVEREQDKMTCAILLSHDLLLQAGLGAGEKAPQLGLGGHWRLESLLAIQVQVNGHCRRFPHSLTPSLQGWGQVPKWWHLPSLAQVPGP